MGQIYCRRVHTLTEWWWEVDRGRGKHCWRVCTIQEKIWVARVVWRMKSVWGRRMVGMAWRMGVVWMVGVVRAVWRMRMAGVKE